MTRIPRILPVLKSRIGQKMMLYVLLFSLLVTAVGTGVQLYFEYDRDIESIHANLEQVESSHLPGIINSLWVTDDHLLTIQLEGILNLPDMQRIEIRDGAEVLHAVGTPQSESIIERSIPLTYVYNGRDVGLGELHVVASLEGARARIRDRVLAILVMQAVMTLLVAVFIFFVFNHLVGRHIISMTTLAESIRFKSIGQPLHLNRRSNPKRPDELDQLVASFNRMRENLIRDIAVQEQAEEALREQERFISAIANTSPAIIYVYDMSTQSNVYSNAGIDQILGYSSNDVQVMGKNLFESLVHPEDLPQVIAFQSKILAAADEDVLETEYRMKHKGGKWRTMHSFERPFQRNEDGSLKQKLGIAIDITERVQAEEEKIQMEAHLRQGQKLESIGTLASGVAHEINNPIMGIMNYAQLIGERLDPSQSQLREFADDIGRETERVAEIVRNLLIFARHGKQDHSQARIADIVSGTLSLIRTIIKRDQITLEVDLPDDLPEIKCRSQQIQQVLMNLMTNARDALNQRYSEYDPDKIIAVRVNLFEKEGRKWIRTTVEDHGAGIPTEIRERIFDPFYTTKDRATGTGLGLSISLGIVQDHHGELTFESEEGQPTRFHLDLPVDNDWVLEMKDV